MALVSHLKARLAGPCLHGLTIGRLVFCTRTSSSLSLSDRTPIPRKRALEIKLQSIQLTPHRSRNYPPSPSLSLVACQIWTETLVPHPLLGCSTIYLFIEQERERGNMESPRVVPSDCIDHVMSGRRCQNGISIFAFQCQRTRCRHSLMSLPVCFAWVYAAFSNKQTSKACQR